MQKVILLDLFYLYSNNDLWIHFYTFIFQSFFQYDMFTIISLIKGGRTWQYRNMKILFFCYFDICRSFVLTKYKRISTDLLHQLFCRQCQKTGKETSLFIISVNITNVYFGFMSFKGDVYFLKFDWHWQ